MRINLHAAAGAEREPDGFDLEMPMPPRIGEEIMWVELHREPNGAEVELVTVWRVAEMRYWAGPANDGLCADVEVEYLGEDHEVAAGRARAHREQP